MCTLSASFSTDPAVDKGLCDKLAAAKAAAASGDTTTKNNTLNAYRQQVAAQSGKSVRVYPRFSGHLLSAHGHWPAGESLVHPSKGQ
jgi:hypothetical protein